MITMAQKDKMQMPQSTAGLVRYFEDTNETVKLKPEYIVGFSVLIIAAEIVLRLAFSV